MRGLGLALAVAVAACGYPHPTLSGGDDASLDGGPDAKELLSFGFLTAANPTLAHDVTATVPADGAFAAILPYGTAPLALRATFVTDGASVAVDGVVQESGLTVNDFSVPRSYVVTALDGSQRAYTIGATVAGFAPTQTISLAPINGPVLLVDLDNDTRLDLVVPTTNGSAFLNTTAAGASVLSTGSAIAFGTGGHFGVASGDFDGDLQVPDLAVVNNDNAVTALVGSARGAPPPSWSSAVGGATTAGAANTRIAVADFDGDHKPDLALLGSAAITVLVNTSPMLGIQLVTFGTPATLTVTPFVMAIGDIDGDGKPDIVASDIGAGLVAIFLNRSTPGTLSFTARTDIGVGMDGAAELADVNGDGKLDLVVANFSPNTVSVLLNTTAAGATVPTFGARAIFMHVMTPWSIGVGDFNGDGKPDIVTPNNMMGAVSILLNQTPTNGDTPMFAAPLTIPASTMPMWVTAGDVNGDGRPDILAAGASGISVMLTR